jgi:Glycosyl hydrolase family 20, domain 2
MKNLTRRDFLETAAQAALAGTAIIRADCLYGRAPDRARDSHLGGGEFGHARLPLSSLIFPEPKNISSSGSDFLLGDQVPIMVPSNSSQHDELLANLLQHELSDRFSVFPKTARTSALSGNRRMILMGSIRNPLVRQYCGQAGLLDRIESLAAEGYLLRADENAVLVAGKDDRGAFYGLQSLRQLLESDGNETRV